MNTFERIEKKFWMSESQYDSLLPVLKENMQKDSYGITTIFSLYFDDDSFSLIRRSIERPEFKEKLRLRSYGPLSPDKNAFLEVKRKADGVGYKRRESGTCRSLTNLLEGKRLPETQIEKEIAAFQQRYRTVPKILITYKRYAMYPQDGSDLRITIDTDLRYKMLDKNTALNSDGSCIFEDDSHKYLMEIKSGRAIPEWLFKAISELGIYQAPFSKVGTAYTKYISQKGTQTC